MLDNYAHNNAISTVGHFNVHPGTLMWTKHGTSFVYTESHSNQDDWHSNLGWHLE